MDFGSWASLFNLRSSAMPLGTGKDRVAHSMTIVRYVVEGEACAVVADKDIGGVW